MKMNLSSLYISPLLSVQKSKEIFSLNPHRPDLQYSYYTYTGYTADLVVLLPPQKIEGPKEISVLFIFIYFWIYWSAENTYLIN
jgi:hypothetical protein